MFFAFFSGINLYLQYQNQKYHTKSRPDSVTNCMDLNFDTWTWSSTQFSLIKYVYSLIISIHWCCFSYIEEELTTQWPKEKIQKDKQRSTEHTHKIRNGVTRTPLKTGGEFRCSGRVSSSCSNNDTRRVNLVASS